MVRFATKDDIERVNELRKQVNDIHVEGCPNVFKPGFNKEMQDFAYVILDGENSDIIVAECEGVICAMACVDYVRRPESPYGYAREFYHVQEIAVDEKYRRRGVARELFEFMVKEAKQKNLPRIELDVWRFNEDAIAFYDAIGFKETRRFLEYRVE